MPSERDRDVLEDMLRHIDLAFQFTKGLDVLSFENDLRTLFAATRCLEIISIQMAAAGNIYRHNYEYVAGRRIWDTIQVALPQLRAVIVAELAQA